VLAASIAVMMEEVNASVKLVNFYQTRVCNIPEGNALQINSKCINFDKEWVLFFILVYKPEVLKC
jgi:hypothetical protein